MFLEKFPYRVKFYTKGGIDFSGIPIFFTTPYTRVRQEMLFIEMDPF